MALGENPSVDRIPALLTPAEVAEILKVTITTVYQWGRIGTLPSVRFGSGKQNDPVRFRQRDIQQFIDSGTILLNSKHRRATST